MDKFVILSPLTYDYTKAHQEVFDLEKEPSKTIPDETLSIKEMLYRFTSGIVDYEQRNIPYDGEFDSKDPNYDVLENDVNPLNDSELSLVDIHNRMQYHYSRYQAMIELEKQKHEEENSSSQSAQSSQSE